MLTPEQRTALEAEARAELWRRGDLSHLRHAGQLQIRDTIAAHGGREFFALCSRRYGKSYEGMCEAIEACRALPGARVLYLAPWARDAALIAGDTASKLLTTCPADCAPEYRAVDHEFRFPNGSVIRLKGTNGEHARYLRGGEAHLVIVDEAGQVDDLASIVRGVLMPMTLTTKGRILYLTTPPPSPGHDSVAIFRKLEAQGATAVFTLRDAPHIDYEEKARILVDQGEDPARVAGILDGSLEPETNEVLREYFCRFVVDHSLAVVPEFLQHRAQVVVPEYPRPPYFDAYGAADMGMRDRTGILTGYLDFMTQTLVVEGEQLLDRKNTAEVATAWRELEKQLGYGTAQLGHSEPNAGNVFLRVVDDPSLRVTADLTTTHKLRTQPADKRGREAAVAAMRVAISSGRLKILARCTALIRQLETAIYRNKESGNDFARDETGHFDLVDALIYLCRAVLWTRNPYPPDWSWRAHLQAHPGGTEFWRPPPTQRSSLNQSVFGGTPAGRRLLRNGDRR